MKLKYIKKKLIFISFSLMLLIFINPSLFLINSRNEIKNPPSQLIKTQGTLSIVSSFSSPAYPTELAWDGEYLWVAENDEGKIYQINSSTGAEIYSFNSPGDEPSGLTWDGLYLWCADWNEDKIYQINASTGAVIYSFDSPGSQPTGLAWDGQYLWNADNAPGTIFKINSSTGVVVASFDSPSVDPKGLAWDGQYLWVSITPEAKIYKIDPSNGVVVNFAYDPGDYASGLAWDGQYLWESDHYAHNVNKLNIVDMTNPVITVSPNHLTVEYGYTGQSLSWTATDLNPYNYTIELQGTGIVAGPTVWTSGNAINYNITDGFSVGSYIYTVNFTDDYDNFITDSVNFAVEDTTNPVITVSPSNFTVEQGYTGQSISWTATDLNPYNYTIELQGTGIVAGPTVWTSGNAINYNITDGLAPGVYTFNITFTDESGNSISKTVTVTITEGAIPFGNFFLIFLGFSVICLIFTKKRQIVRESR